MIFYIKTNTENITKRDTRYVSERVFYGYVDDEGIEIDEDFKNYYDKIDEDYMTETIVEELINNTNFCGTSGDDSLDVLREYVGEVVYDLVRMERIF